MSFHFHFGDGRLLKGKWHYGEYQELHSEQGHSHLPPGGENWFLDGKKNPTLIKNAYRTCIIYLWW